MAIEPLTDKILIDSITKLVGGPEKLSEIRDDIAKGTRDKTREFFKGLKKINNPLIGKFSPIPIDNNTAKEMLKMVIDGNKGTVKHYESKKGLIRRSKKIIREVEHK